MPVHRAVIAAGALASLALASFVQAAETHTVYVYSIGYSTTSPSAGEPSPSPVEPSIRVGDTVRWIWWSGTHDVVGIPGQTETFRSPIYGSRGATYSHTFNTPGTFYYYCSIHGSYLEPFPGDPPGYPVAGMSGRVFVDAGPAPCGLADVASPGQTPGHDHELTADDIIVFINYFFAADPRGDVAMAGQMPHPDGDFTADDIIVFIGAFFEGCPE